MSISDAKDKIEPDKTINNENENVNSEILSSSNSNTKCLCTNDITVSSKNKYLTCRFYKNNLCYFIFLAIYILLQGVAVALQLHEYMRLGVNKAVLAARVFGILLNFNLSLIILLVLRHVITCLRNMKFVRHCLPFDDFIDIHKFIGIYILVLSIAHTIGHSINLYWLSQEYYLSKLTFDSILNETHPHYINLLFTTASGMGWIHQFAMPSGWIALILLILIDVFASSFFRRKGHFELFHYAHWLFVPLYVIMFIHCHNFWKWIIAPLFLIVIEFLIRNIYTITYSAYGNTHIKHVNLLPSRVTQLVIKRPKNFKYRAADYIFIKIPAISIHEWHPFTISSSPELQDELWLHIRSLGNWTNRLHDHFLDYKREINDNIFKDCLKCIATPIKSLFCCIKKSSSYSSGNTEINSTESQINELKAVKITRINDVFYTIHIDGPYGSPSNVAFKSEHIVLIASGIGVTPFAAILQSLWYKYSRFARTCPNCSHKWYDKFESKKLKKVDFIWVNRDYKSFEWFIELLTRLEVQQSKSGFEPFIKFRLFNTSRGVLDKKVLKALPDAEFSSDDERQIFDEKLNQLIENVICGRPNIEQIFSEIKRDKKGDVHVLFCGAPEFGKIIKKCSYRYKFQFSREYF